MTDEQFQEQVAAELREDLYRRRMALNYALKLAAMREVLDGLEQHPEFQNWLKFANFRAWQLNKRIVEGP